MITALIEKRPKRKACLTQTKVKCLENKEQFFQIEKRGRTLQEKRIVCSQKRLRNDEEF